jgi:hypothetical protein
MASESGAVLSQIAAARASVLEWVSPRTAVAAGVKLAGLRLETSVAAKG